MIQVTGIGKIYGRGEGAFVALHDVSFSVPDGGTVAVIGKSGSGKSTLMHIMSGLDRPTSGSLVIDGIDMGTLKRRRMDDFRSSKMSFIFQSFFVEANVSCLQNVMLPLEISGVPASERRKRALEALQQVELDGKAGVLAGTLSGGQKQRLAIARAIVNRPSVLFADEPTGNLDSQTGDRIIKLLFSLNTSLGATLVIVTHDHELAARCKQQIRLKDGQQVSAP